MNKHDAHRHSHECDDPNSKLDNIVDYCEIQGIRLTPLRKDVLSIMLHSKKPLGAYDIMALLKNRPKPAAPPTVYRSLDFLLKHGFVHRLSSVNAYMACCHPEKKHQAAFLICEACNTVSELSEDTIFNELNNLVKQQSFEPKNTIVEVYGTCDSCS